MASSSTALRANSGEPSSIDGVVEWLRKSFRSEHASDLEISYQFELSGDAGGSLWARVAGGEVAAQAGRIGDPDVLLRVSAQDLFAVLSGHANPDLLFMEQRIEIEGDHLLALKLRSLFQAGG